MLLAPTREDLLRSLRAIADPLRLRMLVLLAHPPGPRTGPVSEHEPGMCVSDLRARLGRAHALVSHHVQVLLRAGLIRRVRRGRWSLLQLDTARLEALGEQIASLAGDQLRTIAGLTDLVTDPVPMAMTSRVATTTAPVSPLAVAIAACSGVGVAGAPSW
jgi:ArsR family transcriptional regulator, arsenate/arsenite/antimonite-responsive transcriptional repressor